MYFLSLMIILPNFYLLTRLFSDKFLIYQNGLSLVKYLVNLKLRIFFILSLIVKQILLCI